MLFKFLKYVQPIHYFQLYRLDGTSIFPVIDCETNKELLDFTYSSQTASLYDLSWRLIQKGYVGKATTYTNFDIIPLIDEYIFLRKYFSKAWVLYTLILRLITLKNPAKELGAWWNSRRIKRSSYLKDFIPPDELAEYDSKLVQKRPFISIIIPTLNRYVYLRDVLKDLEKQTYKNFEVIVVDQSLPFDEDFYSEFEIKIKLIRQEERALWLARNKAIKLSEGKLILLFDDDSKVGKDWLVNHLKTLDFFNAEISSGVSLSTVGAEVPVNYSFFRISDQIDTGNVLIKKNLFLHLGLFDRQFEKQRMGDAEFGLRCYLNGYRNISNPEASRIHLKIGTGGLREMGSWDAFRPKKWFAPRPIPSVLYYFRKYFGKERAILAILRYVPISIMPYRFKKNKQLILLGGIVSIILFPLVLIQVIISWKMASKKIKQGEQIGEI